MSHVSFVQQETPQALKDEFGSTPFPGSLLAVGMLGEEGHYTMPRVILEALAGHLGGMVMDDLPPFFVACSDGLVLVLTLAIQDDFMGAAFLLPGGKLETIDRQLAVLWSCAGKSQDSKEFFQGTAFQLVSHAASLPRAMEQCWRSALC